MSIARYVFLPSPFTHPFRTLVENIHQIRHHENSIECIHILAKSNMRMGTCQVRSSCPPSLSRCKHLLDYSLCCWRSLRCSSPTCIENISPTRCFRNVGLKLRWQSLYFLTGPEIFWSWLDENEGHAKCLRTCGLVSSTRADFEWKDDGPLVFVCYLFIGPNLNARDRVTDGIRCLVVRWKVQK
jgi:hypothetical protein